MLDNEVIVITGAERLFELAGYGFTLHYGRHVCVGVQCAWVYRRFC